MYLIVLYSQKQFEITNSVPQKEILGFELMYPLHPHAGTQPSKVMSDSIKCPHEFLNLCVGGRLISATNQI